MAFPEIALGARLYYAHQGRALARMQGSGTFQGAAARRMLARFLRGAAARRPIEDRLNRALERMQGSDIFQGRSERAYADERFTAWYRHVRRFAEANPLVVRDPDERGHIAERQSCKPRVEIILLQGHTAIRLSCANMHLPFFHCDILTR